MKAICLLLFFLPFITSFAQSEQVLIAKADKLEASLDENSAFETFKQVLKTNSHNYYALWKSSELCSRIGNRQNSKASKLNYFTAAKNYGEAAIKVNPNGADGYYALSVAMGKLAMNVSGKDRINMVRDIHTNAEKAIQLNPKHGRAWHVIGKWNYEVSNLNIFEKAAIRLMFGGLPEASLEQSIQAYEKASQYEPYFTLNYLELAKAYKKNGEPAKAINLLRKLPSIPNKTSDDNRIKAEGKQLLQQWTTSS